MCGFMYILIQEVYDATLENLIRSGRIEMLFRSALSN